jgi:uncharacterized membrane protein YphA (DoxX/SURF4 family)
MNNVASILILVFLAISFIQSGYDKLFYWKDRLAQGAFCKNDIKNHVPLALMNILILELISGILCVVGAIQLVVNDGRLFGFYGAILYHLILDHVTFDND